MRLPRSIHGRLVAIALVATIAALAFAGVTIGHVFERFVIRGLDDRLDAQVAVLAGAVRPDGTLDTGHVVSLPGFADPESGWSWEVGSNGRRWTSGSVPVTAEVPHPPRARRDDPRPGEARDARGRGLHLRTLTIPIAAGFATITATGPRRVAEAPLREALVPLLATLALLGLGLVAATLVQLRVGLKPLRMLRGSVAAVIAGDERHVPVDQPSELRPLAEELNLLIDRNAAQLDQARSHLANLAHGLKTPLAALDLRIAESGADHDGALAAAIAAIDRRIAHHLRRARALAAGGHRPLMPLAPAIQDLLAVLRQIHPEHGIDASVTVDPALRVAVDPQDLDEMLGNLLDNAWRHATGRIALSATPSGNVVTLGIEDDGPGLDGDAMAEAMLPGRRLDESAPGHGFGLPITRELAELNGGSLMLKRSARYGGLCAVLRLPGR